MKIAIVINKSWNIFNFRLSLINALQGLGHQILTIAPLDAYATSLIESGCKFIPISVSSRGLNPIKDIQLFFELLDVFKDEKPDIVLTYTIKPNIYGALAARWLKIPIICNVTGLGTIFIRKNPIYKIPLLMYKVAFLYPQKIYFQNNDDFNLFVNKGLSSASKSEIVPGSGVDLNKFVTLYKLPVQPYTFLLVSRILKDKGILEYIQAITILKSKGIKAKFQLLGLIEEATHTGISAQNVEEWKKDGLIEYLGFSDQTLNHFQNADCIVLPSYREGMPKALLEGMAVGKPIITTNVPGCRELIEDGINGYICEAKSAESLADAIEKICNQNSFQLTEMGKRSKEKVQKTYDEKFVISKYIYTINQLTTSKNGI